MWCTFLYFGESIHWDFNFIIVGDILTYKNAHTYIIIIYPNITFRLNCSTFSLCKTICSYLIFYLPRPLEHARRWRCLIEYNICRFTWFHSNDSIFEIKYNNGWMHFVGSNRDLVKIMTCASLGVIWGVEMKMVVIFGSIVYKLLDVYLAIHASRHKDFFASDHLLCKFRCKWQDI